jgi:hypothetical protein
MSTKTNFKRIALVAVAALGFGTLSAVPSQAQIIANSLTVASTAGTATAARSDSTTAATVKVEFTSTAADTVAVSFITQSKPADATTAPFLYVFGNFNSDTQAGTNANGVDTTTSTGAVTATVFNTSRNKGGITNALKNTANDTALITGAANAFNSVTFKVNMDTGTGDRVAGTYTYTALLLGYSGSEAVQTARATVTFTIAALASASTVANAGYSSAFISATTGTPTEDAAISAVATASTTPAAYITVKLRNADNNAAARESVTVTTSLGTVGLSGGVFGRSVVLPYAPTSDSISVQVRPDGGAGVATISISTASVTFSTKSVTFYSATPATLVASVLNSTIGVGNNAAAIGVVAKDSAGNAWAGTLYTYSDTLAQVSDTGTSCSYVAANGRHECTITGAAAGSTAKVTVRSSAATAISSTTVSSNAVTMNVSVASPATVKLSWDKASYAPGEKASLLVSVLDSTGKSVAANTFANLFATGGITLSSAAGNGSETLTATSIGTYSLASLALGTSTDPVKVYTVYMPSSGGTLKASATGGTSLPLAGQVAVSASATITDSGAAALAAVNALATTVASLRTLITTLTNLVLKIQKKVKA